MPNNIKTCSFLHADFIKIVKTVEKFVKNILMGL